MSTYSPYEVKNSSKVLEKHFNIKVEVIDKGYGKATSRNYLSNNSQNKTLSPGRLEVH